jgi:hypothetical protein
MAAKKKMAKKLKIPFQFDEAVTDLLRVKPQKKQGGVKKGAHAPSNRNKGQARP